LRFGGDPLPRIIVLGLSLSILAALPLVRARPQVPAGAPWQPDAGDGTYRNPVLFADYSDPDVVRAGSDFFLVSSSFSRVPGLPILRSRDLVNWTIVSHAAPRLPSPRYDRPQPGMGVWAPSLRMHDGQFWIYFGDPDLGIFLTTARDPRGPWSDLTLVEAGKGWIDSCPLWDDDGQMYLVHAWAKSRAGFNSILTVHRMSADGRHVLDPDGVTVFDGTTTQPTIEGPKFYKRNGWYYIFAPAGGVTNGWQTVLRSRRVLGPYEAKIVLAQGHSAVNGPHQGGWVDAPDGRSWFVHFQDRGAYGRVDHLQPLVWRDDWPVIGADADADGLGEPVAQFDKPVRGERPEAPQTSDEFTDGGLGLQWQWLANPQPQWFSLAASPGALRLYPQPLPADRLLTSAPNVLLQKWPAEAFTVTADVRLDPRAIGDSIALVVVADDYALVRLRRLRDRWTIEVASGGAAEVIKASRDGSEHQQLRLTVRPGGEFAFSTSADGTHFEPIDGPIPLRAGHWVGTTFGLAAFRDGAAASGFGADVDWIRVR
jgi:beta-xylosidase